MKPPLCLLIALCATAALGHWMMPPNRDVPIARLLSNLEAQAARRPKDAEVQYELGRLHSMAFAQTTKVSYYGQPGKNLALPPSERIQVEMPRRAKLKPAELDHLLLSIAHYGKASELDPKNELAQLGLAYMYEVAIPYAPQFSEVSKATTPAELKQRSLTLYRAIYKRNRDKDLEDGGGIEGIRDQFMSQEAGESILRVEGDAISAAEKKDIQAVLKSIVDKPRAITPIILPLDSKASFSDLVDDGASVSFDLAGDGVKRRWPWVTPKAGLLVWDPRGTGRITSGRQLFGSVTFWLFYPDGYSALASLDDNADGWLTGRELNGIGIWNDRNSNGVSDRGEVRPLAAWGIQAIRTKGAYANGVSKAQHGIVFTDGRTVPTYDWMPTSH